jgi:hypothetical protein
MTEQIIDNTQGDNTGASADEVNNGQEERLFTQTELNEILSKRIAQVKQRQPEVDVNEYQELKKLKQSQYEEQMMKRQEFEKLLKQTKSQADAEAQQLRGELEKIKVDGALISAASKGGSVNPEHIAQLLKTNIKLDNSGSVNVVDSEGNVRYTPNADPMSVDDLVDEFLSANTYYRTAGPSGSGSSGNTQKQSSTSLDLSQLDLSRPDHREVYRKMKQEGKL